MTWQTTTNKQQKNAPAIKALRHWSPSTSGKECLILRLLLPTSLFPCLLLDQRINLPFTGGRIWKNSLKFLTVFYIIKWQRINYKRKSWSFLKEPPYPFDAIQIGTRLTLRHLATKWVHVVLIRWWIWSLKDGRVTWCTNTTATSRTWQQVPFTCSEVFCWWDAANSLARCCPAGHTNK